MTTINDNNLTTTEGFEAFSQKFLGQLVSTIKVANRFPSENDFDFLSNSSPLFKNRSLELSCRILRVSQEIIRHQSDGKGPILLDYLPQEFDGDSEQYEIVSDVVDGILERVDTWVDEVNGVKNNRANITINPRNVNNRNNNNNNAQKINNISKPQLKFEVLMDNSNSPFKPPIQVKPNAVQPLDVRPRPDNTYPHPYELEIKTFEYVPSQLVHANERIYQPIALTPYTFVSNPNQLEKLARILDNQSEIAIDLEAHSYRSFQGFVCLMQISTRTEDFIVDTLALRSKMHVLNSSFTNPRIVKVLHGSDSDIVWLQRDFGLYIVNLFDTGQASRILEFPKFSLAWLLSYYCNVEADKQYQMADWRIRPIPDVMIKYAREDTHFLLYIYDRMRNELLERPAGQNLLLLVLERGRELSLKKYEKEMLQETSHLVLYNKYNLVFNPKQMGVFAALYSWRDSIARKEDESTGFILPNHMLFRIAETVPKSTVELLSCCNPLPNAVRLQAEHIQNLINSVVKEPESPEVSKQVSHAGKSAVVRHTNDHLVGFEETQTNPLMPNESPVLTTNQLYHAARWVEGPSTPLNSNKNRSQVALAICSPINNNGSSISPISGLFSDSKDEELDDDLKRSKKTASLIHASIMAEKPRPISYEKPKQKEEKAEQKVEVVEVKAETVPQSMAEIYELSNQIKRKRSQKKQKETEVAKPSDEGSEDEGGKKRMKATEKNSEDFMKDIGWMDKDEVMEAPLKAAEPIKKGGKKGQSFNNPNAPSDSSKKFRPKNPIVPYDYSVHHKEEAPAPAPKPEKKNSKPPTLKGGGKGNWAPRK
eukprot:TRINITY_DN7271_c0_g1_i1.p1 TRINITY_DN7271_c0_g1~~TRINITY_DN7271_c0_g1_i1.p1  ORF type:complete len:832 (-),score=300.13 TRINITY_DN7271_c0_g1_i1:114-2579(-)